MTTALLAFATGALLGYALKRRRVVVVHYDLDSMFADHGWQRRDRQMLLQVER